MAGKGLNQIINNSPAARRVILSAVLVAALALRVVRSTGPARTSPN